MTTILVVAQKREVTTSAAVAASAVAQAFPRPRDTMNRGMEAAAVVSIR